MMKRLALGVRWQRGVAAVEAALLAFPLLILAFGIVDGGRALYEYNTLVKAARDSARYLSTVGPGQRYDEARCLAVTGTTDCSAPRLADGLTEANVEICDADACPLTHRAVPADGNGGPATGVINLVTVRISNYQFVSFVGLPFPSIVFDPVSATMRQAL
jgi:hypothetical protein